MRLLVGPNQASPNRSSTCRPGRVRSDFRIKARFAEPIDEVSSANCFCKNLIPLLLRPLRLALDAETLRPLRIVLLKATHWPFVAMILGYERWRLHLYQRRSRMSHLVRGPNFPNGMRRPLSLSGKQTYKPLLATNSQLADEAMTARAASTGMSSAALDTKDGLEVALANLRAQIETISSIIAKRNEMSNAPA